MIHFRNLTRGILCPHETPGHHWVRIQSTWCEQKRWGDILTHLGADLYYHLADGQTCVIHDASERERETRACWQGLAWIRYATQRIWYGEADPVIVRRGVNATRYFEAQFAQLDDRVKQAVRYYRQFADETRPGQLVSCYHLELP